MSEEATAQAPQPDPIKDVFHGDEHSIKNVLIRSLTDRCIALERSNDTNRKRWGEIAERFAKLRARVHAGETVTRFDLDAWQAEVFAWEQKNFGEQPEYRRVYGVMEELGELCHARLKSEQGIRLDEDHAAKAKDAVGDMLVFLANLCSLNGWSLEEIIEVTWAEVSQRDWTKNKNTGNASVEMTSTPTDIEQGIVRANVRIPVPADHVVLDPRIFDESTQTQIDAPVEVPTSEPMTAPAPEPDDPNAGHGGYDWDGATDRLRR